MAPIHISIIQPKGSARFAVAHLYAWARQTLGPGPGSALKIGFLAGFLAGFPGNFAQETWFAGDSPE